MARLVAVFLILVLVAAATSEPSEPMPAAAASAAEGFGPWETLVASGPDTSTGHAVLAQQLPPASDIEVSYIDVPQEVRPAIEAAVEAWEGRIMTPVKIRVEVAWTSLPMPWLGQTRVAFHVRDSVEDPLLPLPGIRYPAALAHAIRGFRTNDDPDMELELNASHPSWYLGVDGAPGEDQYDLLSVVLHELAHGLGIATGMHTRGFPPSFTSYDTLVTVRDGSKLYTKPLPVLLAALVSDEVFFSGANAIVAAGGSAPRLHAPGDFNEGSSISHLHTFYTDSDPDGLMGPGLPVGWVYQAPGPIVLAMLKDLGWKIAGTGQPVRLRIVTFLPTLIHNQAVMPALRIEVQDAVGAPVPSAPASVVTLEAYGEDESGTGAFACAGGDERSTSGGKATFEGCAITGVGLANLVAWAPGLIPGQTHSFRVATVSKGIAPLLVRGP